MIAAPHETEPQAPPRPVALRVNFDAIPLALKKLARWNIWQYVLRVDEKTGQSNWTKIPFCGPDKWARTSDLSTWTTFDNARARYAGGKWDGIGFLIAPDAGLIGIDADKSIDPETREPQPWAKPIFDGLLPSYGEISPSGTGAKFIVVGEALPTAKTGGNFRPLPAAWNPNDGAALELYHRKFFTITGNAYPGCESELHDRGEYAHSLFRQLMIDREQRRPSKPRVNGLASAVPTSADDQAIIAKARSFQNGEQFGRLWAGDISGYASHSQADLALANMLAFVVGPNEARIDQLFRQSGLMRDKWERDEYRAETIGMALAGRGEFYKWRNGKRHKPASTPSKNGDGHEETNASCPPKLDIDAADQDLARITGRAWQAIAHRNDPPYLFRFADHPARIERSDDDSDQGRPVIRHLDIDRLRHVAAREAEWWKEKTVGEEVIRSDAMPPIDVIKDMLATAEPPLPVLRRIVEAPVVAADGTIVTTQGYHSANRTLYCPADGFTIPPVPEQPSGEDLDYARNLITEEMLHDFPFVDDSDKAVAVAILILPFARDLIRGPTPLHLVEKPCHGTGATLMIDALTYPALGRPIGVMTEAGDEDEWRKRITATLMGSPAIVLLDNLRRPLDSAALSAALTAEYHEDRELRYSRKLRLPVRCVWIATGNNPAVSGEISRRVVACRLDAKVDQPWLREAKVFRHQDLKGWVRQSRGQLVWAALTLIRAWIAAGKPRGDVTLGMFEEWAAVMGGILQVASIPDFLAKQSLERFYRRADKHGEAWRAFAAAWWDKHRDTPQKVSDLYPLVGEIDLGLGDKSDQSRKIRLGKLLGQMEDRVYNVGPHRLRIERGEKNQNAVTWCLREQP